MFKRLNENRIVYDNRDLDGLNWPFLVDVEAMIAREFASNGDIHPLVVQNEGMRTLRFNSSSFPLTDEIIKKLNDVLINTAEAWKKIA